MNAGEPPTLGEELDGGITVVGPGRMGTGIAQTVAQRGIDVTLLDVKDRPAGEERAGLAWATETVRSNLARLDSAGQATPPADDVLDRIHLTRTVEPAIETADWVFEALPEDPAVKTDFLATAAPHLDRRAIVATTTSSIRIGTLAPAVSHPSRLLVTHWLNPAFIVPLVEVAHSDETDEDVVAETVALLEALGKHPVVCADSPGFIGSRILAAAVNEAIRLYEDDVASVPEIDRAMQSGVGFRLGAMGLFEFVDLGGVDIVYDVDRYLEDELGPRFSPPETVHEKVEADELGPETGQGFYDYDDVDSDAYAADQYRAMLALRDAVFDDR